MSFEVQTTDRQLLDGLPSRTARGIAAHVASLIGDGTLPRGTRLPTVRQLAEAADVSVGTVMSAWTELRHNGLIETRRRSGTVVTGLADGPHGLLVHGTPSRILDLAAITPDRVLQPSLVDALRVALDDPDLHATADGHLTDRLREVIAPTWPTSAAAFAAGGGPTEALYMALRAVTEEGDTIVVEQPASPGLLTVAERLGLTVLGLQADDDGVLPESLEDVFSAAGPPAAVVLHGTAGYLPRAVTSKARIERLAGLLGELPTPPPVVEIDLIGPLALDNAPSLGVHLPDVLYVRSYCKAYGLDLRTSVIGGPDELVERAILRRSAGSGATSRILQNALAHQLSDPHALASVDRARQVYASRRTALLSALSDAGVQAWGAPDSLVVWAAVADDLNAVTNLARQGIMVAPGSSSHVDSAKSGLIRISTTRLPDDPASLRELAEAVRAADVSRGHEDLD